jgi:hypothetical protein
MCGVDIKQHRRGKEKMQCIYMYSEVVRLQACDAFKTEQPLLAQDRDQ